MRNKIFIIFTIIIFSTYLFSFEDNESLIFKIKYGFVSAGTASLKVGNYSFRDSISCLKISSLTRTNSVFDKIFKVRDNIESIWDKEKKISYRFTKKLREGTYRQKRVHYYYPESNLSVYYKYNLKKNTKTEKKMNILNDTQDILSAFYKIRSMDLVVGKSVFVNVTADGRNYSAEVKIHKIEKVETIFGKINCFVIEPILKGEAIFKQTGKIRIWLTADEYKIPVKLQSKIIFGSFYAILSDAKNVPYKKK